MGKRDFNPQITHLFGPRQKQSKCGLGVGKLSPAASYTPQGSQLGPDDSSLMGQVPNGSLLQAPRSLTWGFRKDTVVRGADLEARKLGPGRNETPVHYCPTLACSQGVGGYQTTGDDGSMAGLCGYCVDAFLLLGPQICISVSSTRSHQDAHPGKSPP